MKSGSSFNQDGYSGLDCMYVNVCKDYKGIVTLNPKNPEPQTLNPTNPETLSPKYTPNPKP